MKRIILALTAALLLATIMVAAAPAFAQEEKKKEEEKKEEKKEDKDKMKDEKDLPKSGGIPIDTSLLGIGAGTLLVGGGLVAVRVARRR